MDGDGDSIACVVMVGMMRYLWGRVAGEGGDLLCGYILDCTVWVQTIVLGRWSQRLQPERASVTLGMADRRGRRWHGGQLRLRKRGQRAQQPGCRHIARDGA